MAYGFDDSKSKVDVYSEDEMDTKLASKASTSVATTSANGLMSASDKSKLDGITASADAVSFSRSLSSGTKIGTITINGTGTDLYCQTNTNTTYSAGTGLSLSGTTFNHSNSITAKTSYVGSATAVPRIQYDAQGHITACSTATIYPPTTAGSSGQVWVSDGSGAGTWKTLETGVQKIALEGTISSGTIKLSNVQSGDLVTLVLNDYLYGCHTFFIPTSLTTVQTPSVFYGPVAQNPSAYIYRYLRIAYTSNVWTVTLYSGSNSAAASALSITSFEGIILRG